MAQVVKNPPANAQATGDVGLLPGLVRSPGGINGNPFQYSCLGNPMEREAWWAPWGCKESDMTEHAHTYTHTHTHTGQKKEGFPVEELSRLGAKGCKELPSVWLLEPHRHPGREGSW